MASSRMPVLEPDGLMAYWLPEEWHRSMEIDAIGTAAAGLYARCGSFIADSETDGFIPGHRARMYGTVEWIERLVSVGWWSVVEGGYRDELYFANGNVTKAEKQRRLKGAAARQQKWRDGQAKKTSTRESRVSNALRDAQQTAPPFPPPKGGKGQGPGPHPYVDDGQGCCETCGLIPANRAHLRAV